MEMFDFPIGLEMPAIETCDISAKSGLNHILIIHPFKCLENVSTNNRLPCERL